MVSIELRTYDLALYALEEILHGSGSVARWRIIILAATHFVQG